MVCTLLGNDYLVTIVITIFSISDNQIASNNILTKTPQITEQGTLAKSITYFTLKSIVKRTQTTVQKCKFNISKGYFFTIIEKRFPSSY